jgi:transcriptional regulator with AAA-type ATPase domain
MNCAALPSNLIESELFGHEKGAFTDAHSKRLGRFEIANGTTLFLDEIGELPLELQPKLLQVIETGEFERLGSSDTIKVDVRIIAATNRNLEAEVRKGNFPGGSLVPAEYFSDHHAAAQGAQGRHSAAGQLFILIKYQKDWANPSVWFR